MKNNISLNLFIRNALCILLSLYVALWPVSSISQTATLLPNGMQQFFDNDGNPLSSGTVDFFIPNTVTRKNTWKDSAETILNTNPIILDGGGRALIYGDGLYEQILKASNGDLIWDKVVSSFATGSTIITTGDGDQVGTVKPWAGILAPNQYVFANGQEISRTTFSALFTAITQTLNVACTTSSATITGVSDTTQIPNGARIELSCVPPGTTVVSKATTSVVLSNPSNVTLNASATFFAFGNGNGTTTFNIPDLRGYVVAGRPNMGGTASTNLTSAFFGGNNPQATGATGGNQSVTLIGSNLPPYTPTGTVSLGFVDPGHVHSIGSIADVAGGGGGGGVLDTGGSPRNTTSSNTGITFTPVFTGVAQGGTSTPYSIIQPTITLNYIIKVTPDTSAQQASGVASLGGQTGAIGCGAGILCTGNNILLDTSFLNIGANPTSIIGPIVVNGIAATFMRSDGAPPLQQFTQNGSGAIPRTVWNKLTSVVDIADFGASPAASAATNTAAMQAAINSITSTGAAGTVLVNSSNYAMNTFTINGPMRLLCSPFLNVNGGTFDFAQGGGTGIIVNSSYVTGEGCYLNRSGTPQAGDDGISVGTDATVIGDAICTSGSGTVTSASAGFANAVIGMRINLTNCASGPAPLFTSITGKATNSSITISPVASATPGAGTTARYGNVYIENTFRDMWAVNHINGYHLIDAAEQHFDHVYSNSKVGALIENQLNPDYGDSSIANSRFLSTDNTNGAAFQINSSGGLKIDNSKFLFGKYGIFINWTLGNSANPILSNNSIESFTTAGIFITTAADLSRVDITGGSIAGNSGATGILVDNSSAKPLANLAITGVTITGGASTALIDIGKVSGGAIIGNVLDNNSTGTCIALRSNSAAVVALQFANYTKCSAAVTDVGSGNKTVINLASDATGLLPFINMGAKPSFSATKGGTDQTGVASATFTALTWPTVVYNVNGNFASNAWTPPAGKISVFAAFNASGTITAGAQCAISIFKNGSGFRQNLNSCATNDGAASVYIEDLASGSDVYTAQAFVTTSAGTATVQGATNVTYFGGHWIGP